MRRSQYFGEAPADRTPDMYDDEPPANPETDSADELSDAGYYDDDYSRWDLLLGGSL